MGLAFTGVEHAALSETVAFGWIVALSSVSSSGATITITPHYDFTIKFKYFAPWGDRLQAFDREAQVTYPSVLKETVPFDSINLVKFEVVPDEVCSFIAGFQTTSNDSSISIEVAPAMGARGLLFPPVELKGTRISMVRARPLRIQEI